MGLTFGVERQISQIWADVSKIAGGNVSAFRATATSTTPLSVTVKSTTGYWALLDVKLHLSAAGSTGSLQVKIDSGTAAAYDTLLLSESLTAVTDIYWQPTRPIEFSASDEVDITWESSPGSSAITYGLEATYKTL